MPSREVYRSTAEQTRENVKGIANLQVIRNMSASRSDRYLGSTEFVTSGKNSMVLANPPSIVAVSPGNNVDSTFTMRNPSEARQDASRPLVGSGTTGTEFQTAFYGGNPSRTHQGEIELIINSSLRPSGFPVPLP